MKDLAVYEVDFQERLLEPYFPGGGWDSPTASELASLIATMPLFGKLLADAVKAQEQAKFRLLQETIQRGIAVSQDAADILKQVAGTKDAGYRDGELARARVAAERLVRTATNHAANLAAGAFFAANADVLPQVQWVATLDTATCIECADLDGEIFDHGQGPRPPNHLNCRCSIVPISDGGQRHRALPDVAFASERSRAG